MAGSTVAPALEPLRFLEGEWEMELSGAAFLPDGEVVRATAQFEFIDGGRFLALRQAGDATWMIGRDDSSESYTVLYSDERGVSRVYAMSFERDAWRIWRDGEPFAQRFEAIVSADRDVITGRWEKRPGRDWELDFALAYRRR